MLGELVRQVSDLLHDRGSPPVEADPEVVARLAGLTGLDVADPRPAPAASAGAADVEPRPAGGWVPDTHPRAQAGSPGPDLSAGRARAASSGPELGPGRWAGAVARVRLDRPSALALAAAAALVVVVVVVLTWHRRPVPVTAPSRAPAVTRSSHAAGQVVVDVAGAVRHPGLVELEAGSRVADAVRAAGGARPGTDLSGLNLARVVVDGEQVVVGDAASASGGPATAASGAGASASGVVHLNTATEADLDGLPGVGPVTAGRILQWRTEHGSFAAVDQLREVSGIGERTFERLKPLVAL